MNSPTVTVRIPIDILEKCRESIREGKHKNMSELIKKALISYLNLNPENYFFEP
jgi:Arc/MetJ-type ribon-helix-helix transcriptional regulator